MEQILYDNWEFVKLLEDVTYEELIMGGVEWTPIELPHDWLIYQVKDLYETSTGWYRTTIEVCDLTEKTYRMYFEGVYMNSTLYVNGNEVGTWEYGYSSFEFNITSYLKVGRNDIYVQVRHESPNSRWYSGAGIYRKVILKVASETYLESDGTYIVANVENGEVESYTEVIVPNIEALPSSTVEPENKYSFHPQKLCVVQEIIDEKNQVISSQRLGEATLEKRNSYITGQKQCVLTFYNKTKIHHKKVWDIDAPYTYQLKNILYLNGSVAEENRNRFGFRSIQFDVNEGFFLNGRNLKMKGVCLHHDLGALGAAVNKEAIRRQLILMKEMGANAIRTSHGMPSTEMMELCDEMGLLVVDEAYDMWKLPKNPFDNARFFPETYPKDVASWIRRDRNHPSIIMWSIGNEIYDTHVSKEGLEIAKKLKELVFFHDPRGNAPVTLASNYMAWENAQLVAEEIKLAGYNYGEYLYDDHHEKHADWFIYGSETTSTVKSRGIYHFPANAKTLVHEDGQCSSLDNSQVAWGGKTAEQPLVIDRDCKFCGGQFIWTGIDYIGEPTPYDTKNSYFGIVDTAGFPKDVYYMYQSHWVSYKTKPVIHILPYWDFNQGQLIDIYIYSNAPKVELFLNDRSLGKQAIDQLKGSCLHASYQIPYEKGVLKAVGYDEADNMIASVRHFSFGDMAKLDVSLNKTILRADGEDLCFVEINALDELGHFVANARSRIMVEVDGPARLVGMDNGDSTDYEEYKTNSRKLFNGKLLAIVKSTLNQGVVTVKVTSAGIQEQQTRITVIPVKETERKKLVIPDLSYHVQEPAVIDEIPIRKVELLPDVPLTFSKERKEIKVKARTFPANAFAQELTWSAVNDYGLSLDFVHIKKIGNDEVVLSAVEDGAFRLRCTCNNYGKFPQIVSELEGTIQGIGTRRKNAYAFVSAALYDASNVPINVIQDGAIGNFQCPTYISYHNIDFSEDTSSRIRIYVGNNTNQSVKIQMWDRMPNEDGAKQLGDLMIPHNGCWNSYEPCELEVEETLKGMKEIVFVVKDHIIFGGFEFVREERAYQRTDIVNCDAIYGDSYEKLDNMLKNIGNNVVIQFNHMNFTHGVNKIKICGRSEHQLNTIHIRFTDADENFVNQIVEFPPTKEYNEREFKLDRISGIQKVSFVFMPGSKFDFLWFEFE